jgi:hypothetical protein
MAPQLAQLATAPSAPRKNANHQSKLAADPTKMPAAPAPRIESRQFVLQYETFQKLTRNKQGSPEYAKNRTEGLPPRRKDWGNIKGFN